MMQIAPTLIINQDGIDQFESTAITFFSTVLGMDYHSCLLTDEADLSDFSLNGQPEEVLDKKTMSLNQMYDAWDKWVINKVKEVYGIELSTTRTNLLQLFQQIEALTRPVTIH